MEIKKLFLTIVLISAALIWVNHTLYKRVKWYGLKSGATHVREKTRAKSPGDLVLWELISKHLLSVAK